MADGFAKIGTVHQISNDEVGRRKAFVFKKCPPIELIERGLLDEGEFVVILNQLFERRLCLRRKTPFTRLRNTSILHQPIFELMPLKRYLKVAAKSLEALVALADPFSSEFGNEIRLFLE